VTESAPIRFGTDGWRAIIAQEFTFANVERVAQAYAGYLHSQAAAESDEPKLVVVGYDRRFLSEKFAQLAAEVLAGNGFRIALFAQDTPTPLVSWAVKDLNALGGVIITASHNPPDFNGFKIKAPWGGSAFPETTASVEKLLDVSKPKRTGIGNNGEDLLASAVASYRKQIASYIDLERLRAAAGIVIVDSMHGTGGRWVEGFLSGASLRVETIRAHRDPLFGGINPEPIDQNLAALKTRVAAAKALVGLATDGDADRVGAVDERGQTMTMHDVVPLILLHLARRRKMSGGVVRTFSQSILTKRIAAALGLKLYETPIGFKYVADLMLKDDILIGAEESGGIGVKGHIPERDGILNSLLFLEAVITAGKPPSEMLRDLHQEFGEFHFGRRDLRVEIEQGKQLVAELASAPPAKLGGDEVVNVETLDGTKLEFADESWLLFRQSGTEPALRVYAEATSVRKMNELLAEGTRLANRPS
jgi:phosphomannomutase